MDRMRRALPAAVVAALALGGVAGCGSSSGGRTVTLDGTVGSAPPAASTPSAPARPNVPQAYQVPDGVPQTADGGAADVVSKRVITKWLGALTAGNVERAGRFFAAPSKVQNGTPVLVLRSSRERTGFNSTFPCGARATRLRHAARGFTIVDFVLTERKGGSCGTGTGGTARSAIRVVDGHITEWYRLDDMPSGGAPSTEPLPGTQIT